MTVPKRYAKHLTEVEWRRLALDSLAGDDRDLVLNVLNAITGVAPASGEDRRMAVEHLIRYAAQLGACPDLEGITEAETLDAIDVARQALDGLRRGAENDVPDRDADEDGAERKPQ